MINHRIQILEWLIGVGATKSKVLPDLTQLEDGIQMTFDLSNAPGRPMGFKPTAVGVVQQTWAAATAINYSFDGGPGGALIRRYRFAPSSVTSLGADTILFWNNYNVPSRVFPSQLHWENAGGRQFDDRSDVPDSGNARRIIPFGYVALGQNPAQAAVPFPTGATRSGSSGVSDTWHEVNILIPAGDSGYGFNTNTILAAPATVQMEIEFDLFPLQSTSMPR